MRRHHDRPPANPQRFTWRAGAKPLSLGTTRYDKLAVRYETTVLVAALNELL